MWIKRNQVISLHVQHVHGVLVLIGFFSWGEGWVCLFDVVGWVFLCFFFFILGFFSGGGVTFERDSRTCVFIFNGSI